MNFYDEKFSSRTVVASGINCTKDSILDRTNDCKHKKPEARTIGAFIIVIILRELYNNEQEYSVIVLWIPMGVDSIYVTVAFGQYWCRGTCHVLWRFHRCRNVVSKMRLQAILEAFLRGKLSLVTVLHG